jgi:hypothetical protein
MRAYFAMVGEGSSKIQLNDSLLECEQGSAAFSSGDFKHGSLIAFTFIVILVGLRGALRHDPGMIFSLLHAERC